MFAYRGQFLRVDLTAGRVETLPTDPAWVRDYLGGVGMGAKILYVKTTPDSDYYAYHRWSESGIPSAEKPAESNLEIL
jgi:aldehyde:ferredoxin oxidoreductase